MTPRPDPKARDLLEWNGVLPTVRVVQQDGPGIDDKATAFYMVVADYGWAERILCSGSYQQDAEAIAAAIREAASVVWGQAQTDALRRVEAVIEAARDLVEKAHLSIGGHQRRKAALAAALAALDEGDET